MNAEWFRRRWIDFRFGHGSYLSFILGFANTIMIVYFFLIEKVDLFNSYISNLTLFLLIFVAIYIPIALYIGSLHRKTQLRTEVVAFWTEQPKMASSLRLLIDMFQDKAPKNELEEMREFFLKIEQNKV